MAYKMKGMSFKNSPTKTNVTTSRRPTNNPKYKPSNIRIAGPGTRKLTVEAAKKIGKIKKLVKGTGVVGALGGAAWEIVKGYGKLSKTKHGKEIIKSGRMQPGKI